MNNLKKKIIVAWVMLLFISMTMFPLTQSGNTRGSSVEEYQFLLSDELDKREDTFHKGESGIFAPIWTETYGNAWATSIKACNDYIYVAGSVNSKLQEENDILLLKYDTDGNLIWSRTYDKHPYDAAWGIDVHNGYIYVAGYGSDWHSAIAYSDILLLKYGADGNLIWSKEYNKATYDFAYSLTVEENNLYVSGQSDCKSLLLKYDLDGNLEWDKTYSENGEMYSELTHVSGCDGYIYVVGQTQDSNGDDDILLLKYDNGGNIVWDRKWETTGTQIAYGIEAKGGNVYISGFGDVIDIDATGSLLKYSDNGDFLWQTSFEHFKLEGVVENNGIIYVVGETAGFSSYPSDWDVVIGKFDSEGNLLDKDVVYTAGCDIARDVDVFEGNLYVSGSQGNDALILKSGLDFSTGQMHDEDRVSSIFPGDRLYDVCGKIPVSKYIEHLHKTATSTKNSLEVITGAADWLISLAEPASNGYKWPVCENEKEYYTNLMSGVPGVSLFLLRVYEVTGEEAYREYAEGGMNWLMSMAISAGGGYKWPETEGLNYYPTGYYFGAAGIGKVFLDFYQSLKDPIYLQYAEGAASWIRSVNGIQSGYEMLGGSAGIGYFFLKLYDVTGDSQYLTYAKVGGDWLISTAQECPVLFLTGEGNPLHRSSSVIDGCLWVCSDIPGHWITSTGFGHGTAGPVYYLAELYKRCNEQKYFECAEKAARWIIHEAVIEGDGDMQWRWKYRLDQEYSPFSYNTGWCYGNAGIGIGFMSLYEITGDLYYLEILQESADWLIENAIADEGGYRWIIRGPRVETRFGGSFAQKCHGVAGISDYFFDLYNLTGDPLYLKYGTGAVQWLKNVAVETPDGYKWDSDDTGYVFGVSGIGLLLLKAYGMNAPPDKPTCEYDRASDELVVSATDPDGDKVRYGVSWDNDGNVDQWTDFVPSGTEKRIDCEGRTGTVGVIVEDEHGAQSGWSSVTSKNKPYINRPFLKFLENHPYMFSLLQHLPWL